MELLDCPVCQFLLKEPVTVSCGHSFCRRCILGVWVPSKCPVCNERLKQKDVKNQKNNVLLFGIIEKCCPEEIKTWCQIQKKLRTQDFTEALRVVEEAIKIAPDDVSLKMWRAEACIGLQRFPDALQDIEYLCQSRPDWIEGFFRKGNILLHMGKKTEALLQFRYCLKRQSDFITAKKQIKKILEADGIIMPQELPQILDVVDKYLEKFCLNADSGSAEKPNLSCNIQLREKSHTDQQSTSKVKSDSSSKYCLGLCQSASCSPTISVTEDDEDMTMAKEENHIRGQCSVTQKSLNNLTVSEFECPLCIRLFYEPVTTPCGHTFCKTCVERSLDHNLLCPLCKQPLHEYMRNRKYIPTMLLQEIITRLFPSQLTERKRVHDAEIDELSNLNKDIPIFVCTVAYPGIACPLHVFEPRYRLMMRRCMETGTKKFGMCSYETGKGFADYGCMLEIVDQDVFPDGRSYVETVGGSRFRVLRRGQRDGYHTADIEYLQDQKVQGAEEELLRRLHDSVYQQATEWYQSLNVGFQEQIIRQFGDMPLPMDNIQELNDGPTWCWWLLSALQLDPAYQTTVLSLTSLKDRLGHLRIVLEYLSRH